MVPVRLNRAHLGDPPEDLRFLCCSMGSPARELDESAAGDGPNDDGKPAADETVTVKPLGKAVLDAGGTVDSEDRCFAFPCDRVRGRHHG